MTERSAPPTRGRRTGFARSQVDGTPLFYELDLGGDDNAPVVLSDGIGCDGFIWKYLRQALVESGRTVLHWHYRGHGRSAAPEDPRRVRIADLADDLESVVDDAALGNAVLLGHSLGVQVSLEFHRRHRFRSQGLVLICGAHSEPLKTFKGSNLLEVLLPAFRKTIDRAPGLFRSVGRALLPTELSYRVASKIEFSEDKLSKQDFMPYVQGLAHMDPVHFLAILDEASKHSAQDLLPEIRIPTLLIAGELDTFTPPSLTREMAQRIPGAELCVIPEGTHSAPLESPELVREVVLDFLDRLPPAIE